MLNVSVLLSNAPNRPTVRASAAALLMLNDLSITGSVGFVICLFIHWFTVFVTVFPIIRKKEPSATISSIFESISALMFKFLK